MQFAIHYLYAVRVAQAVQSFSGFAYNPHAFLPFVLTRFWKPRRPDIEQICVAFELYAHEQRGWGLKIDLFHLPDTKGGGRSFGTPSDFVYSSKSGVSFTSFRLTKVKSGGRDLNSRPFVIRRRAYNMHKRTSSMKRVPCW